MDKIKLNSITKVDANPAVAIAMPEEERLTMRDVVEVLQAFAAQNNMRIKFHGQMSNNLSKMIVDTSRKTVTFSSRPEQP